MSATPGAYVFDLYGTLVNYGSLVDRLAATCGTRAAEILDAWRTKQIAYSFAASLMERYVDFDRITDAALAYVAERAGISLDATSRAALVDAWSSLPAYSGVPETLAALGARGAKLAILTNATPTALARTLATTPLGVTFDATISIDEVRVYKPSRAVYALAAARLGIERPASIAFVSSNGWDATGAAAFGFSAIWCNRSGLPAETMGPAPVRTISSFAELLASA
jgi:2-haloacid dehalogenase